MEEETEINYPLPIFPAPKLSFNNNKKRRSIVIHSQLEISNTNHLELPKLQRTKSRALIASALNIALDLSRDLKDDLVSKKIDAMALFDKRKVVMRRKMKLFGSSPFLDQQLNHIQTNIEGFLHQYYVKKEILDNFEQKCLITLNAILTKACTEEDLERKIEEINYQRENLLKMMELMEKDRDRLIMRIIDIEMLEDRIQDLENFMKLTHDEYVSRIKIISQKMILVACSGTYTELNLALTLQKMNNQSEDLRQDLIDTLEQLDDRKAQLIEKAQVIKQEIDEVLVFGTEMPRPMFEIDFTDNVTSLALEHKTSGSMSTKHGSTSVGPLHMGIAEGCRQDFNYLRAHIAKPLIEGLVYMNNLRQSHIDPVYFLMNWMFQYHEHEKQKRFRKKERRELLKERKKIQMVEFSGELKDRLWKLVEDEICKEGFQIAENYGCISVEKINNNDFGF